MKQTPEAPGEELLEHLDNLRLLLNKVLVKFDKSGLERTNGLRNIMGRDCEFYQKSLMLFLQNDYEELKLLVSQCTDLFSKVENTDV